jgi:hypothetical protein
VAQRLKLLPLLASEFQVGLAKTFTKGVLQNSILLEGS